MWQFLSNNWVWFLPIGATLFMHLGHAGGRGGHGGCGGSQKAEDRQSESAVARTSEARTPE